MRGGSANEPQPLHDALSSLARRFRRVDLAVLDEIVEIWPSVVEPAISKYCQPVLMKNQTLVIEVPNGAFAQRVLDETDVILAGFSSLGNRAPISLTTTRKMA